MEAHSNSWLHELRRDVVPPVVITVMLGVLIFDAVDANPAKEVRLPQLEHALDAGHLQVHMWDGSWRTVARSGPTEIRRFDGCFIIPYTCGDGCESFISCVDFRYGDHWLDERYYRIK